MTPSQQLLDTLVEQTRQVRGQALQLAALPLDQLTRKPTSTAWNILECLEHLNRYGAFYLPEIDRRLSATRHGARPTFKSGWLGNYFAQSMLPREKLNKMKTFRNMDPLNTKVGPGVIHTFIQQQDQLLALLHRARQADLARTRTNITLPLIKLRLGDTLRFHVNHMLRHMRQIDRLQGR